MRITTCATLSALVLPLLACSLGDTPSGPADSLTRAASVGGDVWGPALNVDPTGASGVNTAALEGCPHESTDGRSLFFASNRAGNLDVWVAQRAPDGTWETPQRLPDPVNSPAGDFCPTPLPGGGLMFVSTRADGQNCGSGTADIYETHMTESGDWAAPRNLGCTVNSAGNEFSPSEVQAAGGMLFFSSDRAGKHALYVSERAADGSWSAPTAIDELNFAGFNTARPNVSQDGREIVFDSDRPTGFGSFDIWYAQRATPREAWSAPVNLGAGVNGLAAETRATFVRDRSGIYFGSTRNGSSDIFFASR